MSPAAMLMASALWMATVGNVALWDRVHTLVGLSSATGRWLVLALGTAVFGALTACLAAFAWPATFKPALIGLLLVAATSAHFSLRHGVVVDPSLMADVLGADPGQVLARLTPGLLRDLVLFAGLPVVWVARQPVSHGRAPAAWRRNATLMLAGGGIALLAVMAGFQPLAATMGRHPQLRHLINPFNLIHAASQWLAGSRPVPAWAVPIPQDAEIARRPDGRAVPMRVIARSGSFALDGKGRKAAPARHATRPRTGSTSGPEPRLQPRRCPACARA